MSVASGGVPEPDFIARDPVVVTEEAIAAYEAATGRRLQPAQVERLLVDLVAYRESLIRIAIQEAAKQNLLAFARYPMLDYLGDLLGVVRLPQAPARTTIRFMLAEAREATVVIPAGARVRTSDGRVVFATEATAMIAPGETFVEETAVAQTAGDIGNGYTTGQIATLLDPIPYVTGARNVTVSHAGRTAEEDDRLRERIREAPERFSVAGPVGAYRWHATSAHQSIVDAAVMSPRPGLVRTYILTDQGLPGAELIELVEAALSDEKVRPLTDSVEVAAPARVAYTIQAELTLFRDADPTSTLKAAQDAAEAYAADRRSRLGCDLVQSQIVAALSVAGVYRVTLTEPAYRALGASEWADCEAITLTVAGTADG